MLKKKLPLAIILSIYTLFCYHIYTSVKPTINKIKTNIATINSIPITKKEESPIGRIIIPKLNIKHNLYDKNSEENNIEKNITILDGSMEPEEENSILFIAAHSGTGKIAYFKHLDSLKENDDVILIYKGKTYYYKVEKEWEIPKNGYIEVPKENNKQLVLTTCSPQKEGQQLIINCIEKEPN